MKKIGKTIFPALIFLFFISGIIFSNEAFSQSANTVASRQDRQTETNTVTVINTDEIRIVTNKQGGHSFQLKHLDILWGTRAALSGMIAAFLLLIAAFSPANSKQNITAVCFITGCALTLSFYPFGISFMIYEWNHAYGLAAMGGGAVLTAITLFMGNRIRQKIKEFNANEIKEMPIPDMFPSDLNPPPPPPPRIKRQ